jgi:hypothetical protein
MDLARLLRELNTLLNHPVDVVTGLVVIGYVIPAIVLWLMVFKPF